MQNTVSGTGTSQGIVNNSSATNARTVINSGTIETIGIAVRNNGSTKNTTSEPAIKIAGGTIGPSYSRLKYCGMPIP